MKWISVEERMPPKQKPENEDYAFTIDVIALLSDGNVVRTYHDGDVWCHYIFSGCPGYEVTHWIPFDSLKVKR